ncbi:MAG: hypothetical protein AAFV53_38100, partial [Myxococcota bacterium]
MVEALIESFAGPGAAFMYVITAVLALGLAVGIERAWLFWLRWRLDVAIVTGHLTSQSYGPAADAAGAHPAGRLIRAGGGAPDADAAWDAM